MQLIGLLLALFSASLLAGGVSSDAKGGARRIEISVTEEGFVPKKLDVKAGEALTLVFTRRTERTCAKDVIVYVDDTTKIARPLPLNVPVEIPVTFREAGERGFACKMGMRGAAIVVH